MTIDRSQKKWITQKVYSTSPGKPTCLILMLYQLTESFEFHMQSDLCILGISSKLKEHVRATTGNLPLCVYAQGWDYTANYPFVSEHPYLDQTTGYQSYIYAQSHLFLLCGRHKRFSSLNLIVHEIFQSTAHLWISCHISRRRKKGQLWAMCSCLTIKHLPSSRCITGVPAKWWVLCLSIFHTFFHIRPPLHWSSLSCLMSKAKRCNPCYDSILKG